MAYNRSIEKPSQLSVPEIDTLIICENDACVHLVVTGVEMNYDLSQTA